MVWLRQPCLFKPFDIGHPEFQLQDRGSLGAHAGRAEWAEKGVWLRRTLHLDWEQQTRASNAQVWALFQGEGSGL
jgi:hypothetical protein